MSAIFGVLARILSFMGTSLGTFFAKSLEALGYKIALEQAAEYAARLLRIGVIFALIQGVIGALGVESVSIYGLWDQYVSGVDFTYIGYFVPLGLLFSLLDLMILATIIMLAIKGVRMLAEASR
jgi:hypothetical protein